jgi:hypothetical protein
MSDVTAPPMQTPHAFPTPSGFIRLGPARYAVWRRIDINGAAVAREVICTNPAYGAQVLAEWAAAVRAVAALAAAARQQV